MKRIGKIKEDEEEKLDRIAIVDDRKCKPKKCNLECKKNCPVVKMGKLCIQVESSSKISNISEVLCTGCGICTKKCPFDAITIINLPKNLNKECTHRYGPNSFKLHRLPMPRQGQVLGLVGQNGVGKSTTLQILAGKLKPNLGQYEADKRPEWKEIIHYFRGSLLQKFFTLLIRDDFKSIIKPQYVDSIPKTLQDKKITGTVGEILRRSDERKILDSFSSSEGEHQALIEQLQLAPILERKFDELSGGELQRVCIAMCCCKDATIYMLDEPSSFLDIDQRLRAAKVIRSLKNLHNRYIVVVEHDLSMLDYLSDYICLLYGEPSVYGVVTLPACVRNGINHLLAGFIPSENLRFRKLELSFKAKTDFSSTNTNIETKDIKEIDGGDCNDCTRVDIITYPTMTKTLGTFKLTIEAGGFKQSEIVVLLAKNGMGKSTFLEMMAGLSKPDGATEKNLIMPKLNVSYKPQKIAPKFPGTVRQLFHSKIRDAYNHPQFISDVMKPLMIEELMDQEVKKLSGGQLQRVAATLCLGIPADVFLIDEVSAYLDVEQRMNMCKVIKRFIINSGKTAFIVEHDFMMATYLADRVIVYDGIPAIETVARSPQLLLTGMNHFLKDLEITFRRDSVNYRPRINKPGSVKDIEQKKAGTYFYLDTDDDEKEKDDVESTNDIE